MKLLLLLLLTGCAITPDPPFWFEDWPGYNPVITIQRAETSAELSSRCRMPRTADAGCANRTPNVCYIHLGPLADACTLTHELKHCRGFNHAVISQYRQDCGL